MKYFRKTQFAFVKVFFVATAMLLGSTSILYSASPLPYTFSPGQTISAAQVNANFQALSEQIAALEAQLAPVSIVGTYDYFTFGTGMEIVSFSPTEHLLNSTQSSYQGTLVFDANGTVTFNGTGGYVKMEIRNSISDFDTSPGRTDNKSLISGTYSNEYPTDIGSSSYTLNGSDITVAGGFVGTLSKDGKIIVGRAADSDSTGIIIAIRRQ